MLLQSADSFGQSAKGQHWRSAGLTGRCALKVNTQKCVSGVLCDVFSKHMLCVSARIIYVRRFRCSCSVLQAHFQQLLQTDTQQCYILCVCDTALLWLDSLTSVTSSLNTNDTVRLENMYVCIYRVQNVFLRCPTTRLH